MVMAGENGECGGWDYEDTESFPMGDFCGFCGDFSWVPLVVLVGFCWVIYLIVYIYYVSYVDGYDLSDRWAVCVYCC